jgi:integrase
MSPAKTRRVFAKLSALWGGSSAGRASRSQCEGREFDPPPLHHNLSKALIFKAFFFSAAALRRDVQLLVQVPPEMYPEHAHSWTSTSNSSRGEQGSAPTEPASPHALVPSPAALPPSSPRASSAPLADPGAPPLRWRPRTTATHLTRGANGVYYVRLVIPERVRELRPDLPRELKRSTKTTQRGLALAIARKMLGELETSLKTEKNMLVPSTSSTPLRNQGFLIEFADGALRTELYPGADDQTVGLFARLLPLLALQVGQQSQSSARQPADAAIGAAPQDVSARTASLAAAACVGTNATTATASAPQAVNANEPSASQRTEDKALDAVAPPEWLSEAIERWRTTSGVRFSDQTWSDAYAPTFRVFRELLGDTRRDIGALPSQLDIRLTDLQRAHMELFQRLLRQYPARQGKRNDRIEAPEVLKRAAQGRQRPQSPGNVAKKLRQIWPFITFAKKKAWIDLHLQDEFSLMLKAAEARATKCSTASPKKGAVALSVEELCRTYQSEAWLQGALQAPWKYWMDPMRLYTGARVSEISQLYTNDVIEVDGIPCISFVNDTASDDEDDGGGGSVSKAATPEEFRRLKNRASRRVIPVHPKLVELGFLEWVKERQDLAGRTPCLLFFGLTWEPKSGYGRKPSRHTLMLLKEARVWQKRRKVGHSLRSVCAQALQRADMPKDMVQRYIGHSTDTELETSYGEADQGPAFPMKRALAYLEKTEFGVTFPPYSQVREMGVEQAKAKQLAGKRAFRADKALDRQ